MITPVPIGGLSMINQPEEYYEVGLQCGRARKNRDENKVIYHHKWFGNAVCMEASLGKGIARIEFQKGYEHGLGDSL